MHIQKSSSEKINSPNAEDLQQQSLETLHDMLRSDVSPALEEIELIQAKIRQSIPPVDTGKSLPHKKTPSGKTTVLHMNYTRNYKEELVATEMQYLQFFAKTANELGIRLDILTNKKGRADVEAELAKHEYAALEYAITESQKPVSKWAEDSVEYLANGHVAVLQPFNAKLLEWAMVEGRKQRWQGKIAQEYLDEVLQDDAAWIPLGIRVNALETGEECKGAAQSIGQEVGQIRAYIEGGNMITGEDAAGKPVLLVGKDAISATANLYQLNKDEVRKLICEDFGLDNIAQVICVEQPGQFHLDMGILFIGHGEVIVNDSGEALKDAVEMAEIVPCMTTNVMAAKLQLQHELENEAAKDLEMAGIAVRREKLENGVLYNFFNGEFVTGKDGSQYYITNGGLQEQQERFEALMTEEWRVVNKVIFSPKEAAHKSLQERGGVGCRLKGSAL